MSRSAKPGAGRQAADPLASAFLKAHAGSGKTTTLVRRVTRLLLAGADPSTILCVTYTKAGAAEMQRRLFDQLGRWAVMDDAPLRQALAEIDEGGRDLPTARALFAKALETPGGLKIQTIHAFCERLLRRFPLEAKVAPGFTVLDDQTAAQLSAQARDAVAARAGAHPEQPVGKAYARFAVELDFSSFNDMFDEFAARRTAIAAYGRACETASGGIPGDVWRQCGFAKVDSLARLDREAAKRVRWRQWRAAAQALLAGAKTDREIGARMAAVTETSPFADIWAVFTTQAGKPRVKMATASIDPATAAWLADEQLRHAESARTLAAARVAEDTVDVLTLGTAYVAAYEAEKAARRTLDFGDMITRTLELLTIRAEAAWVLYKLDNGIDHLLLDEAQDTSPEQWAILDALTEAFFHGDGAAAGPRSVFAVGDEKQSIFSFQGARPERLAAEAQALERKAREAGLPFARPEVLDLSWRSRPEVLGFVDAVFADREAADGLAGAATLLKLEHKPRRGPGGAVDIWPPEPAADETTADPDAPVDAASHSAAKGLAERIAGAIKAMVAAGETVGDGPDDAPRACRFGDFMILVRRRGPLFDEIIRALKATGVPLAGADRLKLSEHGVFADLTALGQFARFPSDDLVLAGLLRSPFCDVDEDALLELAHGRKASLWRALTDRSPERPEWRDAAAFLAWAIEAARRSTPADFYGAALSRLDAAGRSMRQRLLTRLGAEAEESLDGFIAQTFAAEAAGLSDLERFLAWIDATELEIKREPAAGADEVRVMTAHGAKGLEAPIVILPDTTSRVGARATPLLETEGGGFLWAPRKDDDCPASQRAREARDLAVAREYRRLLYVALTRPRDRLIVCGVMHRKGHEKRVENSWYDYVGRAAKAIATHAVPVPGGDQEGVRYGPDPTTAAELRAAAEAARPLPDWAGRLATPDPASGRVVSPSHFDEQDATLAPSPLDQVQGLGRWRRGDLIHKLFERLPDIIPDQRPEAARRMLARERDLDDDQRAEMAAAALAVLADARFAAVFGPGSRSEVAVVGRAAALPEGLTVSGRIDRLVVEAERVLVVDFKTNRPAPRTIEAADPAYVRQLAIYAAVLGEIWPGRRIEAALVWTDGPDLMPVPETMMEAAVAGLAA